MVYENGAWTRQSEAFWRAHHEAWKRSDLNQREYCEAQSIPLKAFGNWRAKFKAEPQPPERKLLYRRRGLSHGVRNPPRICTGRYGRRSRSGGLSENPYSRIGLIVVPVANLI